MIWRDDDVGAYTEHFIEVDRLLHERGIIHTAAVIGSQLVQNHALRQYIIDNLDHIDLQVHCWVHTETVGEGAVLNDTMLCIALINKLGLEPSVLYPPYNRIAPHLQSAAEHYGLTVSTEHYSLAQYVARRGRVPHDSVILFHHWNPSDRELLPKALDIHDRKRYHPHV